MAWKDSAFYSILNTKCPRCHEGEMFPKGSLLNYRRFSKMKEQCSCCGQFFEPEPGYYYGAMFVSYAFSTAIFIGVWILLSLFVKEVTLPMMITALVIAVVVFMPLTFQFSRSVWIHMFIRSKGTCNT